MSKLGVKIALAYAAISFIWGSTWIAIRYGLESLTPIFSAGVRFSLASIFIFILMRIKSITLQTDKVAIRLFHGAEATGHEAKTIHRILEYNAQKGGFQRDENRPLDCDLLVVDESSMIDVVLMHHLLKAVPLTAAGNLVGDVNQLPSVGPGNILGDIIDSGRVPVVRLTEIFRQARQSRIVVNAHRINQGIMPTAEPVGDDAPDPYFYFIEQEDPERALETIVELVRNRIPRRFDLTPWTTSRC